MSSMSSAGSDATRSKPSCIFILRLTLLRGILLLPLRPFVMREEKMWKLRRMEHGWNLRSKVQTSTR